MPTAGDLPFLDRGEAEAYLAAVRGRTADVADDPGVGDGTIFELVLRHELQHQETMLQTLMLARLDSYAPARRPSAAGPGGLTGLELVEVAAGPATVGAEPEGFAYDNERPRHAVDLPAFRIGRVAITNATFLRFVEGGGYQRREWWSDEGWSWRSRRHHSTPHWADDGGEWRIGGWEPLHPDRPVAHVCGSRPTPLPARTALASPPKRSGQRPPPSPCGSPPWATGLSQYGAPQPRPQL